MAITLLETKDHSHTLYVPELDETYHSRNGAIEEAMYVYIGKGLRDWCSGVVHGSQITDHGEKLIGPRSTVNGFVHGSQITDHSQKTVNSELSSANLSKQQTDPEASGYKPKTMNSDPSTVNVLEIGFGTGLNAWLTALECDQLNTHCYYQGLETFPLDADLVSQLNYTSGHTDTHKNIFRLLHEAQWDIPAQITGHFTLHKTLVSLQEFVPQTGFDVIYFDAFAPEKQPELWTEELFRKLYAALNPGGVIVTYSSKGDIKRLWKAIGFEVERLKGPPFKRHMLRGRKFEIMRSRQ